MIWNLEENDTNFIYNFNCKINTMGFLQNNKYLAVGLKKLPNNVIEIWDI